MHFNVVGSKGNFVICVCFPKVGANCVLDISKQYWTRCVRFARHSDPLKGQKGVKRSLGVFEVGDFIYKI